MFLEKRDLPLLHTPHNKLTSLKRPERNNIGNRQPRALSTRALSQLQFLSLSPEEETCGVCTPIGNTATSAERRIRTNQRNRPKKQMQSISVSSVHTRRYNSSFFVCEGSAIIETGEHRLRPKYVQPFFPFNMRKKMITPDRFSIETSALTLSETFLNKETERRKRARPQCQLQALLVIQKILW